MKAIITGTTGMAGEGVLLECSQVGQAMINAVQYGYAKNVIEVKDIKVLAEKANSQNNDN